MEETHYLKVSIILIKATSKICGFVYHAAVKPLSICNRLPSSTNMWLSHSQDMVRAMTRKLHMHQRILLLSSKMTQDIVINYMQGHINISNMFFWSVLYIKIEMLKCKKNLCHTATQLENQTNTMKLHECQHLQGRVWSSTSYQCILSLYKCVSCRSEDSCTVFRLKTWTFSHKLVEWSSIKTIKRDRWYQEVEIRMNVDIVTHSTIIKL